MPPDRKANSSPEHPVQDLRESVTGLPPELVAPDPDSPRGRILASARQRFAEHGFDGTSTRQIAEGAGVNLAMIHYYYGSKEQLYQRVLAAEILNMFQGVIREMPDEAPPEDALLALPLRLMTALRSDARRAALFRRELGSGGQYFARALQALGPYGPARAAEIFQRAYEGAVKSGRLRNLPADSVREWLWALGFSVLFVNPVMRVIGGRELEDESVWQEWKQTLNTLLKQGLLVESKI